MKRRWLQWCNGSHYFRLEAGNCPQSGAREEGLADRVRSAAGSARSYDELIAAGVAEADLLRVSMVPEDMSDVDCTRLLVTPCSGDVTDELATLVSTRNALLLERFPEGELCEALRPEPQVKLAWYARRMGGLWTLVDARYLVEAHSRHGAEDAAIPQRLAAELGVDFHALGELGVGRAIADEGIELARLPTRAWRADVYEDPWDALSIANDRADLFARTKFPLVPPGHLCFLNAFYAPLVAFDRPPQKK